MGLNIRLTRTLLREDSRGFEAEQTRCPNTRSRLCLSLSCSMAGPTHALLLPLEGPEASLLEAGPAISSQGADGGPALHHGGGQLGFSHCSLHLLPSSGQLRAGEARVSLGALQPHMPLRPQEGHKLLPVASYHSPSLAGADEIAALGVPQGPRTFPATWTPMCRGPA